MMEFQEPKKTLRVSKTECQAFEERSVDIDIVLPDYCPDVTTILKCTMKPVVTGAHQSGDRFMVDGNTVLRILYLTEDRQSLYCYEATQPFNVAFRSTNALHHNIEIKQDYVNCRAISPRRMDIHGAFRVYLCSQGEGEIDVFSDPASRDVFCKTTSVCDIIPICEVSKAFLMDETIDLGVNAERLLYTDLVVHTSEHKVLTNKMIIKGVLGIKVVYTVQDQIQCSFEEIPFSQIVDIEGLQDSWECRLHIHVGEYEAMMQQNDNGSSRVQINAKLIADVYCSRQESAEVVLDTYSSSYPLMCETVPIHNIISSEQHCSRLSMTQETDLANEIVSIEDIWGELKTCEITDSEILCCILIGVIGRDKDGCLTCVEKTLDFASSNNVICSHATANLLSVKGSLNGNTLRIQIDSELCTSCDHSETIAVVSSVVEDKKQSYPHHNSAIRIVYVSPGDTVWEIAKRHRADVRDIMAENDLSDGDIHAPTMLMIPTF